MAVNCFCLPDRRGKFDREELKLVVGQKPAGLKDSLFWEAILNPPSAYMNEYASTVPFANRARRSANPPWQGIVSVFKKQDS